MTSDDVGASADIVISTYADRPEYVEKSFDMDETWPYFMKNDEVAAALLLGVIEAFPHLNVLATADGVQVARGMAAPFALHTDRRMGVLPLPAGTGCWSGRSAIWPTTPSRTPCRRWR